MSPSSECSSGCGGGTEANFVEATSAHELAEAISDTAVGSGDYAWSGSGGANCSEIGDVCATGGSSDQATVDGYTVQKVWSNVLNACAADNPNITVAGCTSNSTCSAPTGVCNTTTGTCVQCGSSSDCSASAPVCNTSAGTCGPCTSNSQCTNASDPVCSNGTCGPASSTPDAGSSSSPDASTGGSPDASTGGGSDGGAGLHDASTGGGSDSGSSYGGYGDDSGSTGSGNQADGGTGNGSGDNGSGWSDNDSSGSSGGCSMSNSSNDVSYSGLGIACVAGAMLIARGRRSKRR